MGARSAVLPLALALLPLCLSAQGGSQLFLEPQGADDTRADTGTAVVRGRVTGGDAATPLRGAVVALGGPNVGTRTVKTDEHGRFEFRELPAGQISLLASKPGYLLGAYGQVKPGRGGSPIELQAGQVVERAHIHLARGGVIAGRVTDEFGEPVVGVEVQVLRLLYMDGRRQLVPATPGPPGRSDDQGRYRLYGLPPATYYIVASEGEGMLGFGARVEARSGFAVTYFPGSTTAAGAQPLNVGPGTEHPNVSFALVPTRTVSVSGTVIDSRGRPLAGCQYHLQEGGGSAQSYRTRGGGSTRPDGTFHLGGLAPGEYLLHVSTHDGVEDEGDFETAMVPLRVGTDDITGLTVVTSTNASISGLVISDTGAMPDMPDMLDVPGTRPPEMFYMMPADPLISGRGGRLRVAEDWTLHGRVPPDTRMLIRSSGLPDGWVLKSVLYDGIDVTDSGLVLRSGEHFGGLQLVISNVRTTVSGVVVDARGDPAQDFTVLVFPDDPALWGTESRHFGYGWRSDTRGRFEIPHLPPARYLAIAVDLADIGQARDPEFLERVRRHATPFELREGEQKTLKLRLIAMPE